MLDKSKTYLDNKRYSLSKNFSDEEMARDWTLLDRDKKEIGKYRKASRLLIAVQICSIRLYGRFLSEVNELSPRIVNYINVQLGLPPSLTIQVPNREATYIEHRKNILNYLGFRKFDEQAQDKLKIWIEEQARKGELPEELYHQAEKRLLSERIVLPGHTVLNRLIISVCSTVHEKIFESLYLKLSPEIKLAIDHLLAVPEGEQRSYFQRLKEYPPSAKISALKDYLKRYRTLVDTGINDFDVNFINSSFLDYLYTVTKHYNTKEIKRFNEHKRYALMVCFLIETQKSLLDFLVRMHDQYIIDMCRNSKNAHEKKYRAFRKRQKKAIDNVLKITHLLLDWPEKESLNKKEFLLKVDEKKIA